MKSYFLKLAFPSAYREFPYKRFILGALRATHILCFAVLVGGVFFNQSEEQLGLWIVGTLLTGAAMFFIELYASLILIFEIQSIAIIVKILLLLSMALMSEEFSVYLLMILIIFSSLVSHASRKVRHYSFASVEFQKMYGYNKGKEK